MITTDSEIKVIDLGYGYALAGRQKDGFHRTRLGSEMYMAPEVIACQPYQGTTVDMFSLGVAMLVVRTRRYPFNEARISDHKYKSMIE